MEEVLSVPHLLLRTSLLFPVLLLRQARHQFMMEMTEAAVDARVVANTFGMIQCGILTARLAHVPATLLPAQGHTQLKDRAVLVHNGQNGVGMYNERED